MHYRSLLLPLLLGSLSLGTAIASLAAGGHDHHQHGDSAQTLRLDNGKQVEVKVVHTTPYTG